MTRAALIGLAALSCVAACSKADDAPDAEPTCQVLWASLGSLQNRFDVYLVEMKLDEWTNGEHTFSFEDGVYGMLYDEFDEASGGYVARGAAIDGTFTVSSSLAAPATGGPIAVDDAVGQNYYDVTGADEILGTTMGTGGIASFSGEWSPEGGTVVPGIGSAAVTIGTSGQVVGNYVRYAQCFGGESGSAASSAATSRWPRPRFPR